MSAARLWAERPAGQSRATASLWSAWNRKKIACRNNFMLWMCKYISTESSAFVLIYITLEAWLLLLYFTEDLSKGFEQQVLPCFTLSWNKINTHLLLESRLLIKEPAEIAKDVVEPQGDWGMVGKQLSSDSQLVRKIGTCSLECLCIPTLILSQLMISGC